MAIPSILGALDVDLVLHIFRKMPKERQMKSLADYGNRFYIEMSQHARTDACRRILGHLQLLLLRRQRQRQLPAQGHNREYTRSFPTRERHRPKASDVPLLVCN